MLGFNILIISTLLIVYILEYISNDNEPVSHIVGYIIGYGIVILFIFFLGNYSLQRSCMITATLKAMLSQLVFEKSLKTAYGEISQGDQSGKFTSLLAADVEFFDGLMILPFFFNMPTFLMGSAVLLWFNLGGAGLIGLAVCVCHVPIIREIGKLAGKYMYATFAIGDSRMKLITNLLEGIRIVKLYGWENPYLEAIFNKRKSEIEQLTKKSRVSCFSRSINYGSMGLVMFVTFSLYIAFGNELKASTSFSSVAILIMCCSSVNLIGSIGIMQVFLLLTAMKRITQTLLIKNREKISYEETSSHSLRVRHCTFTWKQPELKKEEESELSTIRESKKNWNLTDINFSCRPGQLIIVIGSVGSGKSALFLGILKEIYLLEGKIALNGNIAIASEQPWIISGTIRENILMGNEMDQEWYNKVIKACSLEKDFELFKEYRDETMIGDQGITLSGGQKARVSLARAVYTKRDVYLLDDPLSAVDPEVCSQLFNSCIKELLADKTVILATHQAHYVSQADKVLILDDGNQIFFGTYEELQDKGYSSYLGKISQTKNENIEAELKKEEIPEDTKKAIKDKTSIIDEERAKGSVPFKIYWEYLMLGFRHWTIFLLFVLLQVAGQISYLSIIF